MQVSWIDAEDVRDYVALLAEPAAQSGPAAPDLDSLAESADKLNFEFIVDKPAAPAWHQQLTGPSTTSPSSVEAGLQPDINRIREKLRLIRDRAREAGLLTQEPPAQRLVPPPAAPAPAPPPALAPLPAPAEVPIETPTPPTPPPASPSLSLAAAPAPLPASSPFEVAALPAAVPPPESAPVVPAKPARSTIVERLDEFAQWSSKQTTAEQIFMLDEHGDLLWGSPTSDDLIVCARLAMNATQRSQAGTHAKQATATPVQASPGQELQLIACPTIHGSVMLVLVNAKQVPAASLREALALALDR